MAKSNIIVDIRPTGVESGYVAKPFDVAVAELTGAGYKIISAEENANLRIQQGKDADVSGNGNYVKEGTLYIPNKGRFITRGSLVLANPKEATKAHRNGVEYSVTSDQADSVLVDAVQVPYDLSSISTKLFGESQVAQFIFGKDAQKYGDFLSEAGIKQVGVYFDDANYVNSKETPYANQLWLHRLDVDSGLSGRGRVLGSVCRVRGVRVSEANSASVGDASQTQNLSGTFNDAHYSKISKVLASTGITGKLEKTILDALRANN